MALHVTLLEPKSASSVGAVARKCLASDASLHLVGPMPFQRDDKRLLDSGPDDWKSLDWWIHPGWRDFRDAMTRERCIYFSVGAEREADEAPFRANSVLVLGSDEGVLPDRILEKYPNRVYRLPMPPRKRKVDIARSTQLLLQVAAKRLEKAARPLGDEKPAKAMKYGRAPKRR